MHLAPVPPTPTPASGPATAGSGGDPSAGGPGGVFAALVGQLLGGSQEPVVAPPGATVAPAPGAPADPDPTPDPDEPATTVETTPVVAVASLTLPAAPVATVTRPSVATGPGRADPPASGPVVDTASPGGAEPPGPLPAPGTAAPGDGSSGQQGAGGDAAGAGQGPPPGVPSGAPPADPETPVVATGPAGPPATAPVLSAAPTAPGQTPAPAPTPTGTSPVPATAQVVPEITRLVARGDGVHRITMRLQPEALGEVRVTLTVRDGEVHVRLAAGSEAQRALAEGAPELRRVLELAGATDPRVVVRDLPAATSATPSGHPTSQPLASAAGGTGHGDASAPGQGDGGPQDHHARTRGDTTARDGLTDGATPLRPEPARRAPTAGIDLTM